MQHHQYQRARNLKYVCVLVLSEVSCKTLEGLDGLKKLIYQVALSMKDSSSSAFGTKLLGRLVSEAGEAGDLPVIQRNSQIFITVSSIRSPGAT